MIASSQASADTFFVDQSRSSSGNGSEWDEAFRTLQEAIDAALNEPSEAHDIWIAQGVYRPEPPPPPGAPVNATFSIPDGVEVYGGYFGDEEDRLQRDLETFPTVLEGQLVRVDGCGEPAAGACDIANGTPFCDDVSCCHLVCEVFDATCCTIAWDAECVAIAFDHVGSFGVCLSQTATFDHARAVTTVSGPGDGRRLDSVIVRGADSPSGQQGGGMSITAGGVQIARCLFEDNIAMAGGAIGWTETAQPVDPEDPHESPAFESVIIFNSTFTRNTAEKIGGAIRASDRFEIVNCLFYENQQVEPAAGQIPWGGAIADRAPDTALPRRIVNCTIVENSAMTAGGGISTGGNSESGSGLEIINSIVRMNTAFSDPQIHGFPSLVLHCNITDWPTLGGTTGNIDDDPLFIDDTMNDFRLGPGSPSVDAGVELDGSYATLLADVIDVNDNGNTTENAPDLAFEPRVRSGAPGGCNRVDMGAYEREQGCEVGNLNEDCLVNGSDLGILLGLWGSCAWPCPADLDCNGVVDGADLGILLGDWGNEPNYPRDCCPESLQSSSMSSLGGSLTLAELIDLLELSSPAEFVDWVTQLSFGEMTIWLDLLAD